MSRENVETVRTFMELFAAGDREVWREHFDRDVVWDTTASTMPTSGLYHGHQGVERFFREWLGAWSDYRIEVKECIDGGNSVVVVFHQSGIGRGSGIRAARDFYGLYELAESKVIRYREFGSREDALQAAGIDQPNSD